MDDIELDSEKLWNLPEGFTGSFTGKEITEEATLYDKETDTIYVYNNYQLLTAQLESREEEPVMSKDMIAENFGMGQMIYLDEEKVNYLTYGKAHHYVLSADFTEAMPQMKAATLAEGILWTEGEKADGRSYPGQVYYEEDGKKYILIGNESQLRAIGSGKQVTPRLYLYHFWTVPNYYEPYYPGDADLGLESVVTESATDHSIDGTSFSYYGSNGKTELANYDFGSNLSETRTRICGVDATGRPDSSINRSALENEYSSLTYSAEANYIIFRNIDLAAAGENSNGADDTWTPINFSGTMIGRVAQQTETLADATGEPVISNVQVKLENTDSIDVSKYIGVGFFATITNEINVANIGVSAGQVSVSNLHLKNISVENSTSTLEDTNTVFSTLTSSLGWLVGGVADLLTTVLTLGQVNLNLRNLLHGILDARNTDPSSFATGSFAGRIVGDVKLSNCTVENAAISSVNHMTGGFVGYTEGVTQYSGLSNLLNGIQGALSSLLNIIPGLGLGDLITILLENGLAVGELIPTGYINPIIENCSVNLKDQVSIGAESTNYNGGFVGL